MTEAEAVQILSGQPADADELRALARDIEADPDRPDLREIVAARLRNLAALIERWGHPGPPRPPASFVPPAGYTDHGEGPEVL